METYFDLSPSVIKSMKCVDIVSAPVVKTSTHELADRGWSATFKQAYSKTYVGTPKLNFHSGDRKFHLTVRFLRTGNSHKMLTSVDAIWAALSCVAVVGKAPSGRQLTEAAAEYLHTDALKCAANREASLRTSLEAMDSRYASTVEELVAMRGDKARLSAENKRLSDSLTEERVVSSSLESRVDLDELTTLRSYNEARMSKLTPDRIRDMLTVERLKVVELHKPSNTLEEEAIREVA